MSFPIVEMCCWCDEPTGNAGRCEDSIYAECAESIWGADPNGVGYPLARRGDEIGPLCEECYRRLDDDQKLVRS